MFNQCVSRNHTNGTEEAWSQAIAATNQFDNEIKQKFIRNLHHCGAQMLSFSSQSLFYLMRKVQLSCLLFSADVVYNLPT